VAGAVREREEADVALPLPLFFTILLLGVDLWVGWAMYKLVRDASIICLGVWGCRKGVRLGGLLDFHPAKPGGRLPQQGISPPQLPTGPTAAAAAPSLLRPKRGELIVMVIRSYNTPTTHYRHTGTAPRGPPYPLSLVGPCVLARPLSLSPTSPAKANTPIIIIVIAQYSPSLPLPQQAQAQA
jgi:hypothetical protein